MNTSINDVFSLGRKMSTIEVKSNELYKELFVLGLHANAIELQIEQYVIENYKRHPKVKCTIDVQEVESTGAIEIDVEILDIYYGDSHRELLHSVSILVSPYPELVLEELVSSVDTFIVDILKKYVSYLEVIPFGISDLV